MRPGRTIQMGTGIGASGTHSFAVAPQNARAVNANVVGKEKSLPGKDPLLQIQKLHSRAGQDTIFGLT